MLASRKTPLSFAQRNLHLRQRFEISIIASMTTKISIHSMETRPRRPQPSAAARTPSLDRLQE